MPWSCGLALLLLFACAGCAVGERGPSASVAAADPLEAEYVIDGVRVRLYRGAASRPAAPGSASRISTRVEGPPARGDLDGDGDPDAVVWLIQDTGGSGTFHHLAAALNDGGEFTGTVSAFLGDRLLPGTLAIRNGVLFVSYRDRPPGAAMSEPAVVDRSVHLVLGDAGLEPLTPPAPGERLLQGHLVIGHEVRSFRPCGSEELWLTGSPEVLAAARAAHEAATSGSGPYASAFVTLIGRIRPRLTEGFGADFAGAFELDRLVAVRTTGHCAQESNGRSAPARR